MSVRGVATTRDQHDLRRVGRVGLPTRQIRVLGLYQRASGARGIEDIEVRRALQRNAGALETRMPRTHDSTRANRPGRCGGP